MPGWIYPFIWLFLWLIQSRLANQRSITKLLHGGSLIGFNLHNGGTLRKWGLNCFSISPSRRLDRFMDLKHVRGIDFIYFIIHSLVGCTQKQASCRSVTITGGTFLPSWTTLSNGIQFMLGMRKGFHLQVEASGKWDGGMQISTNARARTRQCLWHFKWACFVQKSTNNCWYYVAVVVNCSPSWRLSWSICNGAVITCYYVIMLLGNTC